MKNLIILIVIFNSVFLNVFSQEDSLPVINVTIYNTYKDFVDKTGEEVGVYESNRLLHKKQPSIIVKQEGGLKTISLVDKWGFMVGDWCFRTSKYGTKFIYSVNENFVYYEDGKNHLEFIGTVKHGLSSDEPTICPTLPVDIKQCIGFSIDLNSEIMSSWQFVKLKRKDPKFLPFCKCINNSVQNPIYRHRECIYSNGFESSFLHKTITPFEDD